MEFSDDQIRDMVRRVLLRTLGPNGVQKSAEGTRPSGRITITEADVLDAEPGGRLPVPHGALVTPLARDTALDRHVQLVSEPAATSSGTKDPQARSAAGGGVAPERSVALGADHGGLAMKEDLKAYLAELGYPTIDCGTHSADSVDYPDLAYAVAQLVADKRAWRGIVIDGAGIGSCMAANKVPGVRAAMCYDHATATNSREHNDANVLTLGGMLLGGSLARQIVETWLQTDFGGGRHARRVDKIVAIEQRFLRR